MLNHKIKQAYLVTKPCNRSTGRAQTIKLWWQEPHILPSKLSKLMIPRACSLHTLKTIICEPSLTTQGLENSPAQPGGGADDGSMTSSQERQRRSFLPTPYFSFDYKTIAQ